MKRTAPGSASFQEARMGTASMPSKCRFCPLFGRGVVIIWGCLCFLVYLFSFPAEQEGTHSLLLMSFSRDFFNRVNSRAKKQQTSRLYKRWSCSICFSYKAQEFER
jgi:hypothetical protein